MSESRICPVCGNEIPGDARYFCPRCHINLSLLQDAAAVQRAREKYRGEIIQDQGYYNKWTPYISGVFGEMGRRKYYLTGVLVSFLAGLFIIFAAWQGHLFVPLGFSLIFFPIGILAGFVGYRLEKKNTRTPLQKLGLVNLTIILSLFFSFGFVLIFAFFLNLF